MSSKSNAQPNDVDGVEKETNISSIKKAWCQEHLKEIKFQDHKENLEGEKAIRKRRK